MSPPAIEAGEGSRLDDPFTLLGLPRSFALEPAAIRSAHRRRASAAHPDRVVDAGAASEALRLSTLLNEACRTLMDPIARGEALLRLEGASIAGGASMSQEFLAVVMELREEADEAFAAGDAPRISALRRDADARRADLLRDIASDFAKALAAPEASRGEPLAAARERLNELRYVERLVARLSGADGPA